MAMFLVVLRRSGPEWDPARPLEEQSGWLAHASFMDGLVDDGFIILGGPLADEVFELFERMAKAAFKMSGSRGQLPQIQRTDPESLSFLITAAFNFDNDKKYPLLEMTSTVARLTELKSILEKTVGQIEESADIQSVAKLNGHSKKKIDL